LFFLSPIRFADRGGVGCGEALLRGFEQALNPGRVAVASRELRSRVSVRVRRNPTQED
jgi:hypothetical protein